MIIMILDESNSCFIVALASETLAIARVEVKRNSDYNDFFSLT
jgi:hypothetical protein